MGEHCEAPKIWQMIYHKNKELQTAHVYHALEKNFNLAMDSTEHTVYRLYRLYDLVAEKCFQK